MPTNYEYEIQRFKALKRFSRLQKAPSKEDIFNIFDENFISPDHEYAFQKVVVNNTIDVAYESYLKLSPQKKYYLLCALAELFDVTLSIKIWEYELYNAAERWKGFPYYFTALDHMIPHLESMRTWVRKVDKNAVHRKVLCVEGESEEVFIVELHRLLSYSNLDIPVHNYKGKSKIMHLPQYMQEKMRQGVSIFLQYDRDRQKSDFVKRLRRNGCKIRQSFGFKKDFESAFPPKLLLRCIQEYCSRQHIVMKREIKIEDIVECIKAKTSFMDCLNEKIRRHIKKPAFSKILAEGIAGHLYRNWMKIINDDLQEPYNYEIFRFIRFYART
jgi:hypothetical protein